MWVAKVDGVFVVSFFLVFSDDVKVYLFESDNDVLYGNFEDVVFFF